MYKPVSRHLRLIEKKLKSPRIAIKWPYHALMVQTHQTSSNIIKPPPLPDLIILLGFLALSPLLWRLTSLTIETPINPWYGYSMGLNEDNDANMGETIIDNNRVYLGDLIIWGYNAYHAMGMVEMHSAKKNGDFGDGLWHWNCHFTLIQ